MQQCRAAEVKDYSVVFVRGLPRNLDVEGLKMHAGPFNTAEHCRIVCAPTNPCCEDVRNYSFAVSASSRLCIRGFISRGYDAAFQNSMGDNAGNKRLLSNPPSHPPPRPRQYRLPQDIAIRGEFCPSESQRPTSLRKRAHTEVLEEDDSLMKKPAGKHGFRLRDGDFVDVLRR